MTSRHCVASALATRTPSGYALGESRQLALSSRQASLSKDRTASEIQRQRRLEVASRNIIGINTSRLSSACRAERRSPTKSGCARRLRRRGRTPVEHTRDSNAVLPRWQATLSSFIFEQTSTSFSFRQQLLLPARNQVWLKVGDVIVTAYHSFVEISCRDLFAYFASNISGETCGYESSPVCGRFVVSAHELSGHSMRADNGAGGLLAG